MTRTEAVRRLLGPVLLVLASSLIAAVVVRWSGQAAAEARRGHEQARALLDEAVRRLAQVDEERRLIERYGPAYRQLAEAGIVGPEQRVNWIDALRLSSQSLRGFNVDYRLGGQQPARLGVEAPGIELRASTMELNLRLLHEGDLLAFLDALEAQRAGLFLPAACAIERLSSGPFTARFEPKLGAQCRLVWITVGETVPKGAP